MAAVVGSAEYMTTAYMEHQRKYRKDMRESDKATISLIDRFVPVRNGKTLMDIGCHNGNLLYHIKTHLPGFFLRGADIFPEVIAQCRVDPDLLDIEFMIMDLLDLRSEPVDVIVVSAVLFRFDDSQHAKIWKAFMNCLKPGGYVVSFDFYNSFFQTLRIIEETSTHPEGLILNIRSQHEMQVLLDKLGYAKHYFQMFEIPIDLPLTHPSDPLYTYTLTLADNKRLQFRGSFFQPWCHLVAHKAA